MPNNTLYTTAEIALVLRLYNDIRQGKNVKITEDEHNFLKQVFVPQALDIYNGHDYPVITYRHWAISSRAPYYNRNRREVMNKGAEENYQLYRSILQAEKVQQGDQVRKLIYDGQPIELLVQCIMIEMGYKLNLLPKRASEINENHDDLLQIAEELETNGTFNI